MFGKTHPLPRQTAWFGPGEYVYSRIRNQPQPWPLVLLNIKKQVEEISQTTFNSALLNLYTKGHHCIGWHKDNEKELKKGGLIATVSLGGPRVFSVRSIGNKKDITHIEVKDGDLLMMKNNFQKEYEHAVLPSSKEVIPRISITFREWMGEI